MEALFCGMGILICFTVLLSQFYSASKQGCNNTADALRTTGNGLAVLNRRHLVSGAAIAILLLYASLINRDWLQLRAAPSVEVVVLTFILGTAAVMVSLYAGSQAVHKIEPHLPVSGVETYLLLRALFIILYEIFFRGLLLQFCIPLAGVPAAIAINVALYAAAHLFSTRQELLGTVPFGILLCLITLFSRCVWPAVLLHLLLALPYDILILTHSKLSTKTYLL